MHANSDSRANAAGEKDRASAAQMSKQQDEQRLRAWCRALSTSPRRRTVYERLQDTGEEALPLLVESYNDPVTTEIGRHLILLLLAHTPGETSLNHALEVLTDPSDTLRAHALARLVLHRQDPEKLQQALGEAMASARGEGDEPNRFALRQLYRVLGTLTVHGAMNVLDGYVPPVGGGEGADEAGQWAALEWELWQTAMLRAGVRSPVQAYRALEQWRGEHPQTVVPLLRALDAYRHASSDMRHIRDRRHSVRIRAERAVIRLCRQQPLMANVLLTNADSRVRRLAVERLADRRTIGALVFAFEALEDGDRGIANQALDSLTEFGPAAPELIDVLSDTVPDETREHLRGLAEAFPSAEELAELRELREELRARLIPSIHQRTLHDPAAGELYRAWSQVQRYWQRLAVTWATWWHDNGDAFRPAPYRQLVLVLRRELG